MSAETLTDAELEHVRRVFPHDNHPVANLLRAYESLTAENERQRLLNGAEHNQLVSERAAHEQTKARVAELERAASTALEMLGNRLKRAESALASARDLAKRWRTERLQMTPSVAAHELELALSSTPAPVAAPCAGCASLQVEVDERHAKLVEVADKLRTERDAHEHTKSRVAELERTLRREQQVLSEWAQQAKTAESALASSQSRVAELETLLRAETLSFAEMRSGLNVTVATLTDAQRNLCAALSVAKETAERNEGYGRDQRTLRMAAESALASARTLADAALSYLDDDAPSLNDIRSARARLTSLLSSAPVAAPCAGCAKLSKTATQANRDVNGYVLLTGKQQTRIAALTQAIDAAVEKLARINGRTDALEMHECVDDALAALRAARKGQP